MNLRDTENWKLLCDICDDLTSIEGGMFNTYYPLQICEELDPSKQETKDQEILYVLSQLFEEEPI